MSLEYFGTAPIGWTPADRTLTGTLSRLLPGAIATYIYSVHKDVWKTPRWRELERLLFKVQLPGDQKYQLALGTECADLFACRFSKAKDPC